MTLAGLDFKNPVGKETFNCFKKVCVIERNTNETTRSESTPRETPAGISKKPLKSSHKVQQIQDDESESENEISTLAVAGPPPKPWNPPANLKFSCPLGNHKHEVSSFNLISLISPLWADGKRLRRTGCVTPASSLELCAKGENA